MDIYREFGLELKKERFLTVCGKCGGEIEEAALEDPRIEGKMLPTDRQVFVCAKCAQVHASLFAKIVFVNAVQIAVLVERS